MRDLARVVREQWWVIVLCILITGFAAAAYTSTREKQYDASARLLLQPDNLSQAIAGAAIPGVDPTRQAATDAQLVSLPTVAARVSKQLKRPLSATAVKTASGADSNLLTVTVRDRNPKRAALFANAFAEQYIAFRRGTNRSRYRRALATLQSRLGAARPGTPDYATLRAQVKQLRLLTSLQTGDAQLVQRATPPAASVEPRPVRNVVLGLIVGVILGFGLAFLRDRLDRRLKNEESLESLLPGVPVIGLVPEPRRSRTSKMMAAEAFHSVEANLALLARGRPLQTLLVTSAVPGDGKSTVALNLALAMMEKGRSALVLDADLRRPALSERLHADRRVGVSRILAGQGTLATSVQEVPVERARNGDGPTVALEGTLSLVSAGPGAANLQILMNDRSLAELLEASRARSECVIFDGAPVGSFADLLPLAKEVDGVLLVVRLYHSRKDQIKRFATQLRNAAIEPVGVVVLGAAMSASGYYESYLSE